MPLEIAGLGKRRKELSKKFRRFRDRLLGRPVPPLSHYGDKFIYTEMDGVSVVHEALTRDGPLMIARFGHVELSTVKHFCRHQRESMIAFPQSLLDEMRINAGFFSSSSMGLTRFACEMLQISRDIDVLGVWFIQNEREVCLKYLPTSAQLVNIHCLPPTSYLERPWSRCLAGKKVLVIHPYEDSIREQYRKREHLFENPEVLPEFELVTLKAYQSILGNNPDGYADWFAARDAMKSKIDRIDFDVALIGAGAYGIFLAHHCKRLGKKAVHIGGSLQLFFGIKGRRWESDYTRNFHQLDKTLYNDYWVRPKEHETPKNNSLVEDGCYW